MLLASSESLSWLSVVIGGVAVLLGGIGAQWLSIWNDKRKADADEAAKQVADDKALVTTFFIATDGYYSALFDYQREPGKHPAPADTDMYLAFTEMRLWGPAELFDRAWRLQVAASRYGDAVTSTEPNHPDPQQSYVHYNTEKKRFVTAVRQAFGAEPLETIDNAPEVPPVVQPPAGQRSQKRSM